LPKPSIGKVGFDETDAAAARWAKHRAAALVADVTQDTRRAVREVISHVFTSGLDLDVAAGTIRAAVGLNPNQARSLLKFRQDLAEGEGLVSIGKRSYKVPKDPSAVEALVSKKAQRMLRDRAYTIAATESMGAANEGLRAFWEQGRKAGRLDGNVVRVWITVPDERLCETCGSMDGAEAAIDEPFTLPDGSEVMNPPAHPRCRCTQGLVNSAA
jgi:hypothetical protein